MTERHHQIILDGAAIGSVQARSQLAVGGKDRAAFLQGFLTNDVEALQPGTGCYAAWLTPQGRMLTDMHVLASDGLILLDLPRATADATLARLDQFHFSEDVTLASLAGSLTGVWLHGPTAPAVLAQALGTTDELAAWPLYRHRPFQWNGESAVVVRIDQLGVPGFCAYVAPARRDDLVHALGAAGAAEVDPEAIDAARVDAGYPLFGPDMDEETIPLEAGIEDRAISLTKGCYVGQEVIIRVLHRGHGRVARKLVRLTVDGPRPGLGARVTAGERDIGRVTSAGVSPRAGTVALAFVHRDFIAPGSEVVVAGAPARVTPR